VTKKVDMIVDLQYGSTGKGLIAGYIALKTQHDVIVNANMPNAGHTFIDAKGQKMIHKVLPNGIVSPRCKYVLIGPGSVFDVSRLYNEIQQAKQFGYMKDAKVFVHENAVPVLDRHREEESTLESIGSTKQGSMAASIDKMKRNPDNSVIARDLVSNFDQERYGLSVISGSGYNEIIKNAHSILAEGAQGFSLGINEKFYPYCTSRDCSPARFMSDMAIPLPYLRTVLGTARTYPIRVGGTSGGCYGDQTETRWEDLGLAQERTTVTNKVRRVFTFSKQQIDDAMYMFAPDEVFLNFCNYIEDSDQMRDIIGHFEGKVKYLGFGPSVGDIDET